MQDTKRKRSDQENFWAGEFGEEYVSRNLYDPEERVPFFSDVLSKTFGVKSICEFGANVGTNLRTLRLLSSSYSLSGIEINEKAYEVLKDIEGVSAHNCSIQDFRSDETYDLVFTSGVLIHVDPKELPVVLDRMYNYSNRYIMVNEYFSSKPVEISYHGHRNRLFKRDFGREVMNRFGDSVKLVDYGFIWREIIPSLDDTTWFLFEKI